MSGSLSQAIGLAEALDLSYEIKSISLKSPWHTLPIRFIPHHPCIFNTNDCFSLSPPRFIIASSKRTIPAALTIKKRFPQTKIIYLQNPKHFHSKFDAVITPFHDQDERHESIKSLGALHRASPCAIMKAKNHLPAAITSLPKPIHAFLLGGNARSHTLDKKVNHQLSSDIQALLNSTSGSVIILPSRRTPEATIEALKHHQDHPRVYFWNSDSPSPYLGTLGLADHLIVTEESVSMISEACSTGIPTHLYALTQRRKTKRLALFHQAILQSNRAKPFQIPLESWHYEPLEETQRVAEILKKNIIHQD